MLREPSPSPPQPLQAWPVDDPGPRCARGVARPRAIAWFGFTAFWGHLRHLVASAIATENIDSRQWMIPDAPDTLLERVVDVLASRPSRVDAITAGRGRAIAEAGTLAEAMGGDVWIDFVSDTGDDVTASEAVARLFASDYEVDDPDAPGKKLALPRGDILFLGGDLAYPVATVREITRRLVEPWNKVLAERADGAPRVLLAVPGNHDWYDGLDGFARLCQAPCAFEDLPSTSDTLYPQPDEHPVLAWAGAFARGDQVDKPRALALAGYVPVQRASYFRLPLAPGMDLFAVDRQLKRVDTRQVAYFAVPGAASRMVVVPDPARAWGEKRPHGVATLESLGIDMTTDRTLLLAGDVHHYERSNEGESMHIVAGGGGAFLHGSRVGGKGAYAIEAEFPGPRASWKLLRGLGTHCALGRAGWLLPAVFAFCDAVALERHFHSGPRAGLFAALAISLIVALSTALLVGWRRHRAARVVPFATALGLAIGALPVALGVAADALVVRAIGSSILTRPVAFIGALAIATFASSFFFGAMLMLIARLGLNHEQAYAALGSAGYRHFVRLRVRASTTTAGTSHVDAWVIGLVDPVAGSGAVLVDSFRFDSRSPRVG